jgi:hypothetical protein
MFKRQPLKQFARGEHEDNGVIRRTASANVKTVAQAAAVGLGAIGANAMAQTSGAIDTGSVTTAITSAGTAVAVVGAAVLVLMVGIKVWKWIQRAL